MIAGATPNVLSRFHFDAATHSGWSWVFADPPGLSKLMRSPRGGRKAPAGTIFSHVLLPDLEAPTAADVLRALEDMAGRLPRPARRQVRFGAEKLPPVYSVYDVRTGIYLAGLLTEDRRAEHVRRNGWDVV